MWLIMGCLVTITTMALVIAAAQSLLDWTGNDVAESREQAYDDARESARDTGDDLLAVARAGELSRKRALSVLADHGALLEFNAGASSLEVIGEIDGHPNVSGGATQSLCFRFALNDLGSAATLRTTQMPESTCQDLKIRP